MSESAASAFDRASEAPGHPLKDIWRLRTWFAPYAPRVALAFVGSWLSAAAAVLAPIVLSRVVIDEILMQRRADGQRDFGQRALTTWLADVLGASQLTAAALIYLAWILSWGGFGFLYRVQLARASQAALFDLRRDLLAHVEQLAPAFFDRTRVGQILARVTTDVESLSDLLTGIGMLLGELLPLSLAAATMLSLDPVLFAEISPMMLAVALVIAVFRRIALPTYAAIRASLARMQEHLHEVLSGMDSVQLFARERISIARHAALNEENRKLEARAIRAETLQNPIMESVQTFALALLVWLGGNHVAAGIVSLGSLVLFLQYSEMLFRPLAALSEQSNQWLRATAACQRIFRLLDWNERLSEPSQPLRLPERVQGHVEFRALRFRYQTGPEVLRSVDLTIAPGETLALVGPTGSGKSTLARLLCRLYDAPEDTVFLDGIDVTRVALADLRRQVGMILQDFHVFPGTVRDNIALGDPAKSAADVRRAAEIVQALAFIEALPQGFDTPLTGGGRELSNGQRQLLAFARVIALDPRVLVLDEATAGVDPATETAIQRALASVTRGRTSIIIAHRLKTVRDATRIAVVDAGRIVELGNHDQLWASGGLYRALYEAQLAESTG